jgi:hypothetical protein
MHGYKEKKNWEQKRMTLLQSKIKCNKAYVVYSETLSIISLVLINVMNIIDVQTLNIYIYIYKIMYRNFSNIILITFIYKCMKNITWTFDVEYWG